MNKPWITPQIKELWSGLKDGRLSVTEMIWYQSSYYNRFDKFVDHPAIPEIDTSVENFFDHHNVRRALKSVNVRKSSGLDGISPKLLKFCADSIVQPVSRLFNISLQYATFPDICKQARITPLPKCKGASVVKDFRPVAVTSVISNAWKDS